MNRLGNLAAVTNASDLHFFTKQRQHREPLYFLDDLTVYGIIYNLYNILPNDE